MFKWYKDSHVCLVYLSDVETADLESDELWSSSWFSRGWTLQELLAPGLLVFCNARSVMLPHMV